MPFYGPRNVREFHTVLRDEAKGLRIRAGRLRKSANHHKGCREDLREVRLFVADVMEEAAGLIESRVFDGELLLVPEPQWDAEGRPVEKKKRREAKR